MQTINGIRYINGASRWRKKYRGILAFLAIIYLLPSVSFALTIWPIDGKYFNIKHDDGTYSKSVDIAYIRRHAQQDKTGYWNKVYVVSKESIKQWKKHRGLK